MFFYNIFVLIGDCLNIFEGLLISVGLAMDAFAVSICKGISFGKIDYLKSIIVGLWFGLFQALMPTFGFLLGRTFENFITIIDHFIAFFLLLIIGVNMIYEALYGESEESADVSFKTMLIVSIATSIDALTIGIAYVCAYGSIHVFRTFMMIGVVTFIFSFIGTIIGNKIGDILKSRAELLGGLILIFLGFKILIEHLLL